VGSQAPAVAVTVTVFNAVVVYPTTDVVVDGGTVKVLVRGNSPRHEHAELYAPGVLHAEAYAGTVGPADLTTSAAGSSGVTAASGSRLALRAGGEAPMTEYEVMVTVLVGMVMVSVVVVTVLRVE